jgi:hypothetical protein
MRRPFSVIRVGIRSRQRRRDLVVVVADALAQWAGRSPAASELSRRNSRRSQATTRDHQDGLSSCSTSASGSPQVRQYRRSRALPAPQEPQYWSAGPTSRACGRTGGVRGSSASGNRASGTSTGVVGGSAWVVDSMTSCCLGSSTTDPSCVAPAPRRVAERGSIRSPSHSRKAPQDSQNGTTSVFPWPHPRQTIMAPPLAVPRADVPAPRP